jgi:transposase
MIQEADMPKARTQTIKGIPYVYIERSFRVPGKAYPNHTRTYIGKMVDDSFVPNEKFHALTQEEQQETGLKFEHEKLVDKPSRGRPVSELGVRMFRGLDLLLSTISGSISLREDLEKVFSERSNKMLSLAYFLVGNREAAMYRFPQWARLRYHPFGEDIPSPRSSELFGSITEDEIQQFLRLRVQRSFGTSGWLAVDTTSISSFSQALSLVAKGHNKDHDLLEQINLLLVFDQDSHIPVFYRKMRGNITDVTTVDNTLHDLQGIGMENSSLVLDRGFYSKDNVIHLLKKGYHFTLGTKCSISFVKEAIDQLREQMMSLDSYDQDHRLFHASVPISYEVPVRGRGPNIRYAYLHLYCDKEKEADDVASLMKKIDNLKSQLESGKITSSRKELKKYFILTVDKHDRIIDFAQNKQAIFEATRMCGYFALLTSEKLLDSMQVLSIYRKKDSVEKAFSNLKDRLSLRRTRCSRDDNFSGKVFVQFIALILSSHIKKVMREQKLFPSCTYGQLIDEIDVIEYFTYRNRAGHWGEITEKQADLLRAFDVQLPNEAWPKKYQKRQSKTKRRTKKSAKIKG